MKKYIKIYLLVIAATFISCDDILEEDISDDTITIISPVNNIALEGNSVQFRWNELKDADEYRIQITSENQQLILDSTVTASVFDYDLDSGIYEWRVRAENFAYETAYSFPAGFTLTPFSDLTEQEISLTSPEDEFITNDITAFRFEWENIETATGYNFEILNNTNGAIIYTDNTLTDNELTLSNNVLETVSDGIYKWQIRGINASTKTEFYAQTFSYDTQVPPVPSLVSPETGTEYTNGDEVTLTWSFNDTGPVKTEIFATIELASDTSFTNITTLDVGNALETVSFTPTTTGTMYWRVIGIDAAENEGVYSNVNSFTVN